MKTMQETFEDTEFEELKTKKGKATWREFILKSAGVKKR